MDELHYIIESTPLTPEQFDYILKWGRKRTMEQRVEFVQSDVNTKLLEHTNTYALTCSECGKSAALTEHEARVWRNSEEKLGIIAYCACGGIVKLSTTSP
jgi:hypothetical protein